MNDIDPSTVYMTVGRDYNAVSGYECIIGAYETVPSNVALDGSAFPVHLHRKGGFRTNAQARAYGRKWVSENL